MSDFGFGAKSYPLLRLMLLVLLMVLMVLVLLVLLVLLMVLVFVVVIIGLLLSDLSLVDFFRRLNSGSFYFCYSNYFKQILLIYAEPIPQSFSFIRLKLS